jgi:cellulose synthase (UDP-forming)
VKKLDQITGFHALALNIVYLIWLYTNIDHALGWALFIIDCGFTLMILVYLFNHRQQKIIDVSKNPAFGSLDLFLPVVNEPLELFEKTVQAAIAIDYSDKKLCILDDGNRHEIKELAEKYDAHYLCRGNNLHYKAGNLNHGLANSFGEYILVIDADHIVQPEIARELLGHFQNRPELAVVTTRQCFAVLYKDFNNQEMFYCNVQPGKNSDNAAFSCGSAVFYRRAALDKIKGFQTWNIVEDLYTTYILHQNGFQSLYINKSYAIGLAPLDIPTIYKQRGTWALDTLRLLLRKNPFFQKGLSFKQRMHYFETGWAYLNTAICIPILLLLLPLSIFTEIDMLKTYQLFPWIKIPAMCLTLFFFWQQSRCRCSEIQMWIALFPVYLKALLLAFKPGKPKYKVTEKGKVNHRNCIIYILPHLAYLGINLSASLWHIFYLEYYFNLVTYFAIGWVGLIVFWFWPILKKGFGIEETVGRIRETGTLANRAEKDIRKLKFNPQYTE